LQEATQLLVEKEVNPAFQSNSFEPIAIGLGFGVWNLF
jgi:hypothetical protein